MLATHDIHVHTCRVVQYAYMYVMYFCTVVLEVVTVCIVLGVPVLSKVHRTAYSTRAHSLTHARTHTRVPGTFLLFLYIFF